MNIYEIHYNLKPENLQKQMIMSMVDKILHCNINMFRILFIPVVMTHVSISSVEIATSVSLTATEGREAVALPKWKDSLDNQRQSLMSSWFGKKSLQLERNSLQWIQEQRLKRYTPCFQLFVIPFSTKSWSQPQLFLWTYFLRHS